ncbi:MAG: 5-oxoprolinase subunit PxpB [bacterium]
MQEVRILPAGDQALLVEFGRHIAPELSANVRALRQSLHRIPINGILDIIPSYASLLVEYDPSFVSSEVLSAEIRQRLPLKTEELERKQELFVLPTIYGGEFGPDLDDVADHAGLTAEEVVALHTNRNYLVYLIGFTPGFPYLGSLDERIAMPRLTNPRLKIPGGSVGIAGAQTGIYPSESPGGWRLIGQTPIPLFNLQADPPALLQPGVWVRFRPVDDIEFTLIKQQLTEGTYRIDRISHD